MGEPASLRSFNRLVHPASSSAFMRKLQPIDRKRFASLIWTVPWLLLLFATTAFASRTVQDETGRTITLADHISRVVCLTPSVTDTVYALGASNEIVGITDYTQYPEQAAREKTSIGDIINPSLERIVALHPDLVIGVSTLNSPATIQGLERAAVPVFLVKGHGLAGVYSSIESIGRALALEKQASNLIEQLRTREQKVREIAKSGKHPSVFLVVQLEPCITAGHGAFMTELIEIAGARSVTDDLPQDWLRVNLEAIIPRDPDYILLLKGGPTQLKDMQSRPGWNVLRAVKAGKVIRADDRLQSPSPVAFDGLEDLARQIQKAN
jgi:iron complex transport system substrate-binding protein